MAVFPSVLLTCSWAVFLWKQHPRRTHFLKEAQPGVEWSRQHSVRSHFHRLSEIIPGPWGCNRLGLATSLIAHPLELEAKIKALEQGRVAGRRQMGKQLGHYLYVTSQPQNKQWAGLLWLALHCTTQLTCIVYLTPQPCLTGNSTPSTSQQSTASPMSSASWRNSATTFGVTICLATSPLHRLTYPSLPQSTVTATTGTYQVGAGMGPGLQGGWAASSICKGPGVALRPWRLAPTVQRSGFLLFTNLAISGSHLGLLVFYHLSSWGFCCHPTISLSPGPCLWFPSGLHMKSQDISQCESGVRGLI